MDVTSEYYEPFNEAEDNEDFDTGDTSNDTRDNHRDIIRKIRNKKSKVWDYLEIILIVMYLIIVPNIQETQDLYQH